jgi:signal transduction histidine kinase
MGEAGALDRQPGGSLAKRTIVVSIVLSAVIGAAFFLLAFAINALDGTEARANHAQEVVVAANRLERLVIDIQSTQRGFIITGQPRFLGPWHQAIANFRRQAPVMERLARSGDAGQGRLARQITRSAESYIRDYSVPLLATARRNLNSARTPEVTEAGKRLIDAIRNRFDELTVHEQRIYEAGRDRADATASWAFTTASVGVAGSIALILISGGYLARSVVRPVRRASAMAGRVAGGDLTARMPESGPGEVGRLERSFNEMTDSLETSRDQLRRAAEEQAALRRVAILVARGVSPPEVFSVVAGESGRLLDAEATGVTRFEPDGSAVVVGSWDRHGPRRSALPLGWRTGPEEGGIAGRVRQTGKPARVWSYDQVGSTLSAWARKNGIGSSVGSPIVVEGRLWGAVVAFSGMVVPHPPGTELRLQGFTELAAMAIANTESRAQLAASRARVVAAADETRRRIERDLHDGTQQRLISLALELRTAEAQVPADQKALVEQWSRTAQGLTEVIEELREISRGLHPVILEKGGLEPALRALARRAGIPVELDVQVHERLPGPVEVAAYYVLSEALTNAAKHARATVVEVEVGVIDDVLRMLVRDDGVGGADPSRGSGLVGLSDRVEAVGGTIQVTSPLAGGTTLLVKIPLPPAAPDAEQA